MRPNLGVRCRDGLREIVGYAGKRFWVCLALAIVIGASDYLSGTELSFGIIYLLPIVVAALWQERRQIVSLAAISAIFWLSADLAGGHIYTHPLVPLWNTAARLGTFLFAGLTVHALRQHQLRRMDLINYVVHDLRNPLMTFTGTLELVAVGKDLSPGVRECVALCEVAARRMKTLIDSILNLARLEAGKLPIEAVCLNVEDVVSQAIHETSVFASSKSICIQEAIVPGTAFVWADEVLLHRVLVNLLTNAIKVSSDGATVRLHASSPDSGSVVFAIVDSGPGFPEKYLKRVFDKYVQIELRASGVGCGLGLTFCRMATRAMKGRIWIENAPDVGASVFASLPACSRCEHAVALR